MNSKVIKFVAGAGKTTDSEKYLKENKNGLYLAFTNSVVQELENKGYLSKTIDSLFVSYIIPKLTSIIPLVGTGANIIFRDGDNIPQYLNGVSNIKIHNDGDIYNKTKKTIISMNLDNTELYKMNKFPNDSFIKNIFGKDSLYLNDEHRAELSNYIISAYPNEIIEILNTRFSYIIIDEAQDLKGYREEFAKLLYNSNIYLRLLGDDNQNINGGGDWFESLVANEEKSTSFRCPEKICEWIRNSLAINIYGNSDNGEYKQIDFAESLNFDNGKRVLLYNSKAGKNSDIIDKWRGPKETIKKAKGSTISDDVVIIGNTLNDKNLYTAITRTKKNVYSTIKTK